METPAPRTARAAACALALAVPALAPARPPAAAAPLASPGTYRVRVTANVRASPVVDERFEREVEVTLAEPARDGALRVRLENERYSCEIAGRLSASGEVSFDPQQRCSLVLAEPAARGRIEARLESGGGRLRGEKLEVDVSWALSGSVSLLVGGTTEVLGRQVELPAAWMPEVPLRGTVRASGNGAKVGGK